MENINSALDDIKSSLASINAYLAVLNDFVIAENEEKKKKEAKKKKHTRKEEKERNMYVKKATGEIEVDKDFAAGLSVKELAFYQEVASELPRLCKLKEPLLFAEYCTLCEQYGKGMVNRTMRELENHTNLKKYHSVYKTLSNWIHKD